MRASTLLLALAFPLRLSALDSDLPRRTGATAGADRITVTFHGDASTAAGFTWYTPIFFDGNDLQLAERTGAAPDFGGGLSFSSRSFVPRRSSRAAPELAHKAEAAGLKPGAAYYYRVGDASLGLWSSTGTFVTAPASGAFTFLDAADTQAKTAEECELSAEVLAKAFAAVPQAAFLAINGDIVDKGSKEEQWRCLLGRAGAVLTGTTLLPVAGNHEDQKSAFSEHFNVKPAPGSSVERGAYYSVDYSNAHFIVLNTNENTFRYAGFSTPQARWLREDAAAARARGAGWLIVVLHKGPYTTSSHATESEIAGRRGLRKMLAPLLAELGVDLVLQGHDHIFARSKPIDAAGKTVPASTRTETFAGMQVDYYVDPGAPLYLIPNAAGAKVYGLNKKAGPEYYALFEKAEEHHAMAHGTDPTNPDNPVRGYVQNFTAVTIDGGKLTAVTYEIDRTVDGGRPFVMDQFGIIKGPAPTAAAR